MLVSLFCGGCTFDGYGYPNPGDHGPPPPDLPPDAAPLIPDIPSLWPEGGPADQSLTCAGTSCPLGCNTQSEPPRCWHLGPSTYTLVAPELAAATADLVIDQAGATINTDTGEIKNGSQVVRPPVVGPAAGMVFLVRKQAAGYPDLGLFMFRNLTITERGQLSVVGSRALAIYVAGSATIDGLLRAAAVAASSGSGGFAGGAKNGAAAPCIGGTTAGGLVAKYKYTTSNQADGGGGGGGRLAPGGGGGGWYYPFVVGAAGGKAVGDPSNAPLFGGCGGGAGGGPDHDGQGEGGYGGGGGGAIQISVDGPLSVGGIISVPGAGGQGGSQGAGGGGGGSGGAILLEAVTIELEASALLAANGGGGGGGAANRDDASPAPGEDGHDTTARAAGGIKIDGNNSGGRGGQGGARGAAHGDRGADQLNGGGGGGAAGFIRLVATVPPTSQPGAASSPGLSAAPVKERW